MSALRCTFHHRGDPECGRPENHPIHVRENERMCHGCHVFRVEHAKRSRVVSEYRRGYDTGYHAGLRHALLSEKPEADR